MPSRGSLTWKRLGLEIWRRIWQHQLADRAALLSYYFLLAFFPLLIFLSTVTGFLLASQTQTYLRLLRYLARFMPNSAFLLFSTVLGQITAGATGGKLSFGLILTLWTASSGISALIQALNIALDAPASRSWWRQRLLSIGLTLSFGLVLAASLLFLLVTSTAGAFIAARLPILDALHGLSTLIRWLVEYALLYLSLILIYWFGPNVKRKSWEGILLGTTVAVLCWVLASLALRFYLSAFGSLTRSYGSIAGVIALLFWLYASAAAILLGGELYAIVWHRSAETPKRLEQNPRT